MSKATALANLAAASGATPPPAAPPQSVDKSTQVNTLTPGVVEATPAAEPAKPELESTRFASLAKREEATVKERERLKAERAAFEAEKAELTKQLTPFQEFQVLRSKDPVAALQKLGFSETDIVNFLAANEKKELTPEEKAAAAATAEIEKFKKEQADKETKAQADRDAANIKRFRGEISSIIKTEPDKFEYCAYNGPAAEELIYDTIRQVLFDTEELITAREAAEMVEAYYEAEDKAMQDKIKKRKAGQPAPAAEAAAPTGADVTATAPKPKTVTNAATATIASAVKKPETREEKRARLEARLRNGS